MARWRAAQEGGSQQQKARRPYLASECEDLREAEKWRNQVISEIARKVSQIQNGMYHTTLTLNKMYPVWYTENSGLQKILALMISLIMNIPNHF